MKKTYIDSIIQQYATSSEITISYVRIAIALLMIIRFIIISPSLSSYLISLPPALLAIFFSVSFIYIHRNKTAEYGWLWTSVLIDSIVCFFALLSNVLNPWNEYHGNLLLPDTSIILIVTFASGFRISTRIAAFGGIANISSLSLLAFLDQTVCSVPIKYEWYTITMWLIMLSGSMFAAIISAWLTRTLTVRSAQESIRLERVRSGMKTLLHTHHDAHSILSSAHLNAANLAKSIIGTDREISDVAKNLLEDLRIMKDCMQQVQHSADGHIKSSLDLQQVELNSVVDDIVKKSNFTKEGLVISFQTPPTDNLVIVAGGAPSLNRMIMNLLKNAHEGNGSSQASAAEVCIEKTDRQVCLTIGDNGPGIEMSNDLDIEKSSKIGGFQAGLSSVQDIAIASGGSMEIGRSPLGGALVRIVLLRA